MNKVGFLEVSYKNQRRWGNKLGRYVAEECSGGEENKGKDTETGQWSSK